MVRGASSSYTRLYICRSSAIGYGTTSDSAAISFYGLPYRHASEPVPHDKASGGARVVRPLDDMHPLYDKTLLKQPLEPNPNYQELLLNLRQVVLPHICSCAWSWQ